MRCGDVAQVQGVCKRMRNLFAAIFWFYVALIFLFVGYQYFADWRYLVSFPYATDFYKFYYSGERLHQGLSMYWQMPPRLLPQDPCFFKEGFDVGRLDPSAHQCLHPNLNPPFFALLVWPLSLLPYDLAWGVWYLIGVVCGALGVVLVLRGVIPAWSEGKVKIVACLLGFFVYYPTFVAQSYGQVTLILFLMLVFAWLFLRRGCEIKAGVCFGLLVCLKPFAGLVVFGFLALRLYKASISFFVTCALVGLICLVVFGWGEYLAYMHVAGDVTWLGTNWNASYAGYFSRIFGGGESVPLVSLEPVAQAFTMIFSLGSLVVVFLILSKVRARDMVGVDIMMALLVPAMLLVSPLGWMYYFPWLFITFVVIWRLAEGLPMANRWRSLISLPFVATSVPRVLEAANAQDTLVEWFWTSALYNYALFFIFVIALCIVRVTLGSKVKNVAYG